MLCRYHPCPCRLLCDLRQTPQPLCASASIWTPLGLVMRGSGGWGASGVPCGEGAPCVLRGVASRWSLSVSWLIFVFEILYLAARVVAAGCSAALV